MADGRVLVACGLLCCADAVGEGDVPADDGVHRGLPVGAAQVQVSGQLLPPQHLPQRDRVPVDSGRQQGLEAVHHHQAAAAGRAGPAG